MGRVRAGIERIGGAALRRIAPWRYPVELAARALWEMASPRCYNHAIRTVLHKQIYFTAFQILPSYTFFMAVFSFLLIQIVVGAADQYGLSDFALELSIRILVIDVLPLITALFVALRSGAAINTEIALMKITNEYEALRANGVDPLRFELIPRVLGGMVSVFALTTVSSMVAMGFSFLAVYGPQPWAFEDFSQTIAAVFSPRILVGLWLKIFLFGLLVTVIPIAAGMNVPRKLFFAPISVLQGMVRLFFALMLLEVISLALRYT